MNECVFNSKKESFKIEYGYTTDNSSIFYVYFESEKFRGRHTFFLAKSQLEAYIIMLRQMYDDMYGGCRVCDCESDSFFSLEYETKVPDFQTKHWILRGQLGCTQNGNFLRFCMETDQSVIKSLINVLTEGIPDEH